MLIKFPHRISPAFIQEHPNWIFVYSTDASSKGGMGMQWQMAGFPNSFPVPTLIKFCANKVFFDDYLLQNNIAVIDSFIRRIPFDINKPLIVPPKLGLGCARMKEMAPKTYWYLMSQLKLKTPPYDYKTTYS